MTITSAPKALAAVLATATISMGLAGCATKTYVNDRVDTASRATDTKIGEVQKQVESNQSDITALRQSNAKQDEQIGQLSDTAKEALARAVEAGKLAQGKFLYEVQLTDDAVHFPLNSAALSKEAEAALDGFVGKLTSENKNVYIEIQGHTDSSGEEAYNLALGERRADAVRRYLAMHGVPLHRMNVISYGESKPIADNSTREGRATNRRVTLVVLQ